LPRVLILIDARAQDRIKSAFGAAIFHALLGYAFITSLGIDVAEVVDDRLKIFDVPNMEVPPPIQEAVPLKEATKEPSPRRKPAPKDPEGAAAPPNIKSKPTEIVAPKPEIRLPVPSPVIAAPIAGPGAAATSGNAPFKGPGTGAGGIGTGTGSGRWGNGGGGGGGAGIAREPRLIREGVSDRDYPQAAMAAGVQGTVHMRFLIATDGRIGQCRVTRSSGNAQLDRDTCRVMQRRLLYRPAADIYGRAVPAWVEGVQEWYLTIQPDRWEEASIPDDDWE
jgi:periplasmic protein TonB